MRISFLCIAMALAFSLAAFAQDLIHSRDGLPSLQSLGRDADVVGDLDGDDYQDFAVVNLRLVGPVTSCDFYNEIEFISGRDGHVIRRRLGRGQYVERFFKVRATGDIDGDGRPDYAVLVIEASTQIATLQVCRATDDQVIWSVSRPWVTEFGTSLLSRLDLDGDGRPDVVIGARSAIGPDPSLRGSHAAYSSTGQLLYEVFSSRTYAFVTAAGLERVADRVGDLDGDGCEDFIVGMTFQPGPTGIPGVGLISGRTGALIRFSGGELGENLSYCVAALGDLDGDGVRDYAAGNGGDAFAPYGIVRTFSGRTGQRIGSWFEPRRTQYFGEAIVGGMDADRDGIEDVWISSSEEVISGVGTGVLRCFSGRDGRPLFVTSGLGSCGRYVLLGLGVQPDHPFPRYVVVNTCGPGLFQCGTAMGVVSLFRSNPPGVTPLGDACTGTLNQAPQLGLYQRDGAGLRLSLSAAPPGALCGVFLGFSSTHLGALRLPHPLDPYGFPGCSLFTSSEYAFTRITGTSGLQQGCAFLDLPEPYTGSSVPGLAVHAQGIVLDPLGGAGAVTDALSFVYR